MDIIETVRFDREEYEVFKQMGRWLSFMDYLDLDEKEQKQISRITRNDANQYSRETVKQTKIGWLLIIDVIDQRIREIEARIDSNEWNDGAMITGPKAIAEDMIENWHIAQQEIHRGLRIMDAAINAMRSPPIQCSMLSDECGERSVDDIVIRR